MEKKHEEGKLNWFEYDELICSNAVKQQIISGKQISIMTIMFVNKMIVDPQELDICNHCITEWNWVKLPNVWGLDWEWEPDEYEEEIAWQ